MRRQSDGMVLGLLIISAFLAAGTNALILSGQAVPQNLTEHSWIYSQGTISDMRIYQTEAGYNGQKLVTGTRGTGTVSRSIDVQAYGGFEDGYNEIWANEWGVFQNRPTRYAAPITKSDLKNALCAKNYEVGSVYSESYSDLVELIKDTSVAQDNNNSVYSVHSEVEGTAKVGAHVQRSASAVPIYTMTGQYTGYLNMRMSLESGNASILTLPCP
ncbi:MAG: hypothetical protein LUQ10_00325 [Methanothrix sp.]|jgi:hypothetical protein|nr:hypothetical protein [Methanothrix sp.]